MPARILIADDEPHIRRVVEMKLQSGGHLVRATSSGAEALQTAKEYLPELVITDYKMPGGMTGVDLIMALRGCPEVAKVPVILLTGSVAVLNDLDVRLREVPFVTILSKPFSPRLLLKQVQEILDSVSTRES